MTNYCVHRRGPNYVSRGITKLPNGQYCVQMFNKVRRRFKDLELAVQFRDRCLENIEEALKEKTHRNCK